MVDDTQLGRSSIKTRSPRAPEVQKDVVVVAQGGDRFGDEGADG